MNIWTYFKHISFDYRETFWSNVMYNVNDTLTCRNWQQLNPFKVFKFIHVWRQLFDILRICLHCRYGLFFVVINEFSKNACYFFGIMYCSERKLNTFKRSYNVSIISTTEAFARSIIFISKLQIDMIECANYMNAHFFFDLLSNTNGREFSDERKRLFLKQHAYSMKAEWALYKYLVYKKAWIWQLHTPACDEQPNFNNTGLLRHKLLPASDDDKWQRCVRTQKKAKTQQI